MSYFDYEFIPLPLSPAAETESVVSTAAEIDPMLSTATDIEPVVSTAVGTVPEASTATPDQPCSQPNQPEHTESEPNSSTSVTTPTQPSVKGRRGRKRKNPEEKQEQGLGKKKPLRSQGEKTQEQSPGQQQSSDAKHRRRRRCGQCPGCRRQHDCGECTPCKHMLKFGGNGSWNRVCIKRLCDNLQFKTLKSSKKTTTSGTRPGRLAAVLTRLPTHYTKHGRKIPTGRPPSKLRCGTCVGCLRNLKLEDCRQCIPCRGKKKYGGSGKSHRICIYRECETMKYHLKMNKHKKKKSAAGNIPEASEVKKERLDHATEAAPEVHGESLVRPNRDGYDKTAKLDVKIHCEKANAESEASQEQTVAFAGSDPHPPQSTPGDTTGPVEDEIDRKPTLLEVLKFPGRSGEINIPQTIGTNYLTFGILLLCDEDGTKVDAVAEKHGALGILKSWVQGEGQQPVTWRTLVQVLKDSNFTALAEEIEDVKSSFVYVHVV